MADIINSESTINELLTALIREISDLNQLVLTQNTMFDRLAALVTSTKAAAVDASNHAMNNSVDIDNLMNIVNDMTLRMDNLEKAVRNIKIYKSAQEI